MEGHNKKKRISQIMCLCFSILFFCCLACLTAYFIGQKKAEAEMQAVLDAYVSEGRTPGEEAGSDGLDGSGSFSAGSRNDMDGAGAADGTGNSGADDGNGTDGAGTADGSGDSGADEDSGETREEEKTPVDLSLYGVTDRSIDWTALQEEENKDIYAWIIVPGTIIDYPVLQHPEEMDYYLEHNLDGSKGRPGCIYTQRMNNKDWSDRNTVLYGHNMRVGTMFAGLHDFEDADFFEENRYIHIYSEDGRILVYEIFAAYAFSDVHLLLTYDFYTEEGFEQYLDTVEKSAEKHGFFQEEAAPDSKDNIITLSTCIRGNSSQRYLVQGVLIAEGEQP